jgi:hypothetical protein
MFPRGGGFRDLLKQHVSGACPAATDIDGLFVHQTESLDEEFPRVDVRLSDLEVAVLYGFAAEQRDRDSLLVVVVITAAPQVQRRREIVVLLAAERGDQFGFPVLPDRGRKVQILQVGSHGPQSHGVVALHDPVILDPDRVHLIQFQHGVFGHDVGQPGITACPGQTAQTRLLPGLGIGELFDRHIRLRVDFVGGHVQVVDAGIVGGLHHLADEHRDGGIDRQIECLGLHTSRHLIYIGRIDAFADDLAAAVGFGDLPGSGFVDIGQHDPGDIFSLAEHAAQHGRLSTGSDDNYLLHRSLRCYTTRPSRSDMAVHLQEIFMISSNRSTERFAIRIIYSIQNYVL